MTIRLSEAQNKARKEIDKLAEEVYDLFNHGKITSAEKENRLKNLANRHQAITRGHQKSKHGLIKSMSSTR